MDVFRGSIALVLGVNGSVGLLCLIIVDGRHYGAGGEEITML